MKRLALDIGSTSIKGAVLDEESRQVTNLVAEPFPSPVFGMPPTRFEVEPEPVVERVERLLKRLVEAAPDATKIYFCGQMAGLVLVDDSGRTHGNYISWRDQRTLDKHSSGVTYLESLRARWTAGELAEIGNELKPGSTSSLLYWLAERNDLPPGAMPATIGDYVVGQLCAIPPRMDPTQAIGMVDLRTGDWHRPALDRLGLGKLAWQPLAKANEPVGYWPYRGQKLTCYAVLGDQQTAIRGAGVEEGDLSLNVSTGAQLSQITTQLSPGEHSTRPYFNGKFLNTISHLPAGRSLNALVGLLTELALAQGVTAANPWPYIARMAEKSDGGGLACDLSFFPGPAGESGSLKGMTTDNLTVGNLFHAAFRNMAEVFRTCAERLCPQKDWRKVVLSGGLTQSAPILRKMIEAKFPGAVRESSEREETLMGLLG